jgi:hypothetical protein
VLDTEVFQHHVGRSEALFSVGATVVVPVSAVSTVLLWLTVEARGVAVAASAWEPRLMSDIADAIVTAAIASFSILRLSILPSIVELGMLSNIGEAR